MNGLHAGTWLDLTRVEELVAQRYIHKARHPTRPLYLYDYTRKAMFDGFWTPETMACRGLILDETGVVVARPLDKFFNLDEHESTRLSALPDGPLEITDKLDGSLIVLRWDDDEPVCSTRGAFISEQAVWATSYLRARHDLAGLDRDLTLCFEAIYPANRVVLNYGDREELVLLAARRIDNGAELAYEDLAALAERFGLPLVPRHRVASLGELLTLAEAAEGIEGWVVRFSNGVRVKIKVAEYRRLHKLISGLNAARVRDALLGQGLEELLLALPEEFWPDVRTIGATIEARVATEESRLRAVHADLLAGGAESRKAYALLARERHQADMPYLFPLLDGKDIRPLLLKAVDLTGLDELGTRINRTQERLDG
jgi:RNA ligase